MAKKKFLGLQYPLVKTPRGILSQKSGIDQIKADLLQLLLTNPGERCLTGDTLISLANGTEHEIKELVGKAPFWVYSFDIEANMVVSGLATAHQTLKNAELVEIELDNGEKIRCTPDHLWMLRNGQYCRANELISGTSLMPLYRNLNTSKYERVYQPALADYRETHLCFVEGQRLSGVREVVHHKDLNKRNNDPDNLEWMTCKTHKEISNAFQKKLKNDPKFREDWLRKQKEGLRKYYETHDGSRKGVKLTQETKRKLSQNKQTFYASQSGEETKAKLREAALTQFATQRQPAAWEKRRQKNHKVVSVKKLEVREDCYDLKVEKYHNFALSAGVFVHNCMLPEYGTPLRRLIFEPNDTTIETQAKAMIVKSIETWEPRIIVSGIEVSHKIDRRDLNNEDTQDDAESILSIKIKIIDPENISEVDELVLELPTGGS